MQTIPQQTSRTLGNKERELLTIAWVRTKVSFAILRSALLCLRGLRTIRGRSNLNINDTDIGRIQIPCSDDKL